MLTVLDLFSGLGGFSLGLERTGGFKTVAFCEIDPFARRVLATHWPEVPCYDDVRSLTAVRLHDDGIGRPDVICGGFPCQDISLAGPGGGIHGERSGLWREYRRVIGELRPGYVIVENVTALLNRGMDVVLGDLASLGYDAEWHAISAAHVGAPHRRDRVWIVAYPSGQRQSEQRINTDALRPTPHAFGETDRLVDAFRRRAFPLAGGTDDGVPNVLDRLRCLGNAVVPQIPEIIGHAILASIRSELKGVA